MDKEAFTAGYKSPQLVINKALSDALGKELTNNVKDAYKRQRDSYNAWVKEVRRRMIEQQKAFEKQQKEYHKQFADMMKEQQKQLVEASRQAQQQAQQQNAPVPQSTLTPLEQKIPAYSSYGRLRRQQDAQQMAAQSKAVPAKNGARGMSNAASGLMSEMIGPRHASFMNRFRKL